MTNEKTTKPFNGYLMLSIAIILLLTSVYLVITASSPIPIIGIVLALFLIPGLTLVNPNNSKVLLLFGKYVGTIKENGLFWVLPFYSKRSISLRASNFDSERLKVNDQLGNPIMISTILVWRVTDTYKAAFEVDDYKNFVRVQTDAAVRKLASMYPYDNFADEGHTEDITLRSSVNEVSEALEKELQERLSMAGIEVLEARIGYLAYAQEIVLCSDKDATPVVNAGTLNH